jgi:fatty-acyl-CoA synthase
MLNFKDLSKLYIKKDEVELAAREKMINFEDATNI